MRAFILGNSGELLDHDLSLLEGEVVFGTNNLPMHSPEIISHYVCCDMLMGMLPEVREKCFEGTKKYYSRIVWNTINEEEGVEVIDLYPDNTLGFSFEPKKVWLGGTVTYAALQLAAGMGYNPIYTLGIDLGLPKNGVEYLPCHYEVLNILKRKNIRQPFVDKRVKPSSHQELTKINQRSFRTGAIHLQERGIEVYNLSEGGNLKCFPRKNYEELFKEKVLVDGKKQSVWSV